MTKTERELLDASQEIGGICESAAWFTSFLADEIEASGKPVGDFTVAELSALYRRCSDEANKALANKTIDSTKH